MTGTTPAWFIEATQAHGESKTVRVRDALIHYRVWNPGADRVVLLVHGAAANTHWWDHIAPFIAKDLRVVALDLSGHGDSGWRDAYSVADWGHEVAGVIGNEKAEGKCVIVAHSLGGLVAHQAIHQGLEAISGLIILDSHLSMRSDDEIAERKQRAKPTRIFESRTEAMRAYRTRPHQLVTLAYVKGHVAEKSLRAVEGGWTWKFDPRIYHRAEHTIDIVRPLPCPGIFVRAGHGSVSDAALRELEQRWGGTVSAFDIPEAGHHLMFDVPIALISALRAALHAWGFAGARAGAPVGSG